MNTESLRIFLSTETTPHEWAIEYRGWAETPVHPAYPTGAGQNAVLCLDRLDESFTGLASAVAHARAWAEGSGFKIGPPKFQYSNSIEFKLRRP